jgi:hypothetical protein
VKKNITHIKKSTETQKSSSDLLLEEIEVRDENVQEILTKVPHWMIRWGSVLFFSLIFMFLIISWFVKHPDTVVAEVTLSNRYPNQEIILETTEMNKRSIKKRSNTVKRY